MIFANTKQAIMLAINNHVGIAPLIRSRDRSWFRARSQTIEALVSEISKVDRSIADCKITAAILMYTRAGVKRLWEQIGYLTIRGAMNNDIAATFFRAGFDPIDIGTVNHNLPKCDSIREDEI